MCRVERVLGLGEGAFRFRSGERPPERSEPTVEAVMQSVDRGIETAQGTRETIGEGHRRTVACAAQWGTLVLGFRAGRLTIP